MIARVALLLGLVGIQLMASNAISLTTVKARWALLPFQGYYQIPLSTKQSGIKEYVAVPASLPIRATLYCRPKDPRVCWMYDAQSNIIGVQISFLEQDVKNVRGFDYRNSGNFVRTNIFGIPAYSVRAYFANPATLPASGRPKGKEVVDGVWIQVRGKIVEMPRWDPKVSLVGDWNKQGCFPSMGTHYFHGMNSSMSDCSNVTPFGLYHDGSLIGLGVPAYGKSSVAPGGRNWYEDVPLLGVKAIMPNRPSCIDTLTTTYGLYSTHVYFVEHPVLIGCL